MVISENFLNSIKISVWLFLLLGTVYLFSAGGKPYVEADYQLEIARNFVQNASLESERGARIFRDGHYYDYHGIANILLMVPLAASEPFIVKLTHADTPIVMSFLASLSGVVTNALTGVVFFLILRLWGNPTKESLFATYCLAFLTIIFPYASSNYEGNLNMFAILAAAYGLFVFYEKNKPRALFFSGFFSGLALNCREFSLVFLLCVLLLLAWESLRGRKLFLVLFFLSGLVPFLFLWGYYNHLRTGYFFISAQMMEVAQGQGKVPAGDLFEGLRGLLLGIRGGIFFYSPILIMAILGLKDFIQKRRREALFVFLTSALFILANAKILEWFPWGWGPRYVLEITPLLMLPLVFFLQGPAMKSGKSKVAFFCVFFFSLMVQFGGVFTNWQARIRYVFGNKANTGDLSNFIVPQWFDGVRTFLINIWNLLFGTLTYIENPGYSNDISELSLRTAQTINTWWCRLLLSGVNFFYIVLYLCASVLLVMFCLIRLEKLSAKNQVYRMNVAKVCKAL